MNLFITITNANFDREAIIAAIKKTLKTKGEQLARLDVKEGLTEAALWNGYEAEFNEKAQNVGVLSTENEDIRSLRELITYGLKGLAAYSKHANALIYDNEDVDAFIQKALTKIQDDSLSVDDLVALTLETGKFGVDGMALLDKANTEAYGNPEITKVDIGVRKNPGILISGHVIWKCFWNRQKIPVWMCILIRRCFRHTIIRHLRNILTLPETMEMRGGSRKMNLNHSMDRSL